MKTDKLTTQKTILSLLEKARLEIESKGKKLSKSDEQLVRMIMDKIAVDDIDFAKAKEQESYLATVTHKVAWQEANAEESDEIIRRLKYGNREYVYDFFYGYPEDKDCVIDRLRTKIISNIRQTYGVEVTNKEFGSVLHLFLWDNGTWSVLDKYSRKGSFFSWLAKVAHHEVVRYLEKMGYIAVNSGRTVDNTRLLGRSVAPELWEYIISDIMPDGQNKQLLLATLVERKSEARLAEELNLNIDKLHKLQKRAEADLKDRLLRGNKGYDELVLCDNSHRIVEVSEEFANDLCAWAGERFGVSPLADVFGVNPDSENLRQRVVDFLYKIPDMLKWSEEDRMVWTLRYIENTAPIDVAERVGRDRSWVDTRFSRLNASFKKAVKKWWTENAK